MIFHQEKWVKDLSPAKRSLLEIKLKNRAASHPSVSIIPKRKRFNRVPLSFSQQRLWFLKELDPDSSAYNVATTLKLKGTLNEAILNKALDLVVGRHESLRTTFIIENEFPVQLITESQPAELFIKDFSHLAASEREAECRKYILSETQYIFDLRQAPLFRCRLLKLDDEEHILLFINHHIISDGWSMAVFFRELTASYEFLLKEEPPALPELPIQYADYAIWQSEWLKGDEPENQLVYWKKQLEGSPPILKLPTDHPRPPVQTFSGAQETIKLSKELTESLKALSQQENVTLFMALLAAFNVLLLRYTGQEDFCVGTPVAGRTRTETEGLIGPLINMLVLRVDLSGNPDFKELLKRVRQVALDAYNNQDIPFEKLVEELQPERNLIYTPIFQVMFNYRNVPDKPKQMNGITLAPFEIERTTSKFDLTLDVTEMDDGLLVLFEYNTDLFRPETIKRILCNFQNLLNGVSLNLDERVNSLPLLTDKEQRKILNDFNNTTKEYPVNLCIHHFIERQTKKTPGAIALIYEDRTLTYKEVNEKANQLAHYLQVHGVGPEVLVGICIERSMEMVIALLGILKAGGAYLPLDPSYPKERLKFMIDDAKAEVLLTKKNLLEIFPDSKIRIICLDRESDRISGFNTDNLSNLPDVRNLAYVIYTSGSTGKPKGVALEHKAVVNHMCWRKDQLKLNSKDLILQKTLYSFDGSVWELFLPLMFGARLLLARPEGHKDPAYLIKLIREHKVTKLQFVPSMLQIFLESKGVEECVSIKILMCGGEVLSYDLKNRFFSIFNAQLINLYGPTEANLASCWDCSQSLLQKVVPIGYPISNYKLYILDKFLQPVPIGVSGELYIGGVGLARGYINRSDLTYEKFIDNPFETDSNERLYKTGDMACYLPDGAIKFLGRTDHQVKIRGFRIELGEIESVLNQHPGVKQVVVLAREDEPGNKRLVAYIVPEEDSKPLTSVLRDFLKKKLPDYMIPSVFMMLESLPLTPNGKVDRKALPVPDQKRPELEKEYAAPGTPTEIKLAEIWSRLLNIKEVGINDNFFELGGHSLLATQLISRIAVTFQVDLPLRIVFESPIIAEMALKIEQIKEKTGESEELSRLLDELEELSDEEAQQIVNRKRNDI